MKDDRVYLEHILECVRRIETISSEGRETSQVSHLHQDAVLRNLQTMAEATQRLSNARKAMRPGIEWQHAAAFRNILVHNYLGIDLDLVWDILQRDVPALKAAAEEVLHSIE